MDTIIINDNTDFCLGLISNKKILSNIYIKCIITTKYGIEDIRERKISENIFTWEDFKRCKIRGLENSINKEINIKTIDKFKDIRAETYKFLDFENPNNNKFTPRDLNQAFNDTLFFTLSFIDKYKPKLIFFTNVPHAFNTYILYKVCLKLNILTIFKREISLPGFFFFQNRVKIIPLVEDYKILDNSIYLRNKKIFADYIKKILKNSKVEIMSMFLKSRNHELVLNSIYIKIPIIFYLKRIIQFILLILKRYMKLFYIFIFTSKLYDNYVEDFYKEKNSSFKDSRISILQNDYELFKGKIRKLKLLKKYNNYISPIDLDKKFIYFPLHYQPEATTYPFGGVFSDQILALRLLAANIPKNYFIYVKEHPDTFNTSDKAWSRGDHGRDLRFYKDIFEIPKVKLVNINFNSLDLIDKCSYVATIAGAVGLEAIFKNKKVIVLGYPWYSNFPTITNLRGNEDKLKNLDIIFNEKISKSQTVSTIKKFCKILFKNEDLKKEEYNKIIVDLFLQSIKKIH